VQQGQVHPDRFDQCHLCLDPRLVGQLLPELGDLRLEAPYLSLQELSTGGIRGLPQLVEQIGLRPRELADQQPPILGQTPQGENARRALASPHVAPVRDPERGGGFPLGLDQIRKHGGRARPVRLLRSHALFHLPQRPAPDGDVGAHIRRGERRNSGRRGLWRGRVWRHTPRLTAPSRNHGDHSYRPRPNLHCGSVASLPPTAYPDDPFGLSEVR